METKISYVPGKGTRCLVKKDLQDLAIKKNYK